MIQRYKFWHISLYLVHAMIGTFHFVCNSLLVSDNVSPTQKICQQIFEYYTWATFKLFINKKV